MQRNADSGSGKRYVRDMKRRDVLLSIGGITAFCTVAAIVLPHITGTPRGEEHPKRYIAANQPSARPASYTKGLGRVEYAKALGRVLEKFGDQVIVDTDDAETVIVRTTNDRCLKVRPLVVVGGDFEHPENVRVFCMADGRAVWSK